MIPGLVGKTSSPCYGQLFEDVFEKAEETYVDHDVHSWEGCRFTILIRERHSGEK